MPPECVRYHIQAEVTSSSSVKASLCCPYAMHCNMKQDFLKNCNELRERKSPFDLPIMSASVIWGNLNVVLSPVVVVSILVTFGRKNLASGTLRLVFRQTLSQQASFLPSQGRWPWAIVHSASTSELDTSTTFSGSTGNNA